MNSAVSRDAARAIEWDCARSLTQFFNFFDQWRYDDMVALFAPDGVWHRQGKVLKGEGIKAALEMRSRSQTVRHVITNMQVDVVDAMSAQFLLYVTAYMHDSGKKSDAVPRIQMPHLLVVVPGKMVDVDCTWKIAHMSMIREFEFGPGN